jgi:hypothetical protein
METQLGAVVAEGHSEPTCALCEQNIGARKAYFVGHFMHIECFERSKSMNHLVFVLAAPPQGVQVCFLKVQPQPVIKLVNHKNEKDVSIQAFLARNSDKKIIPNGFLEGDFIVMQ